MFSHEKQLDNRVANSAGEFRARRLAELNQRVPATLPTLFAGRSFLFKRNIRALGTYHGGFPQHSI